jgi:hypothetical protein
MTRLPLLREPLPIPISDSHLQVEFFGLPGSGKTTIAREVYAMLASNSSRLIFAPELLRDEAGVTVRAAAKLRLILSDLGRGNAGLHTAREAFVIRQARLRDKIRAVFTIATVASLYKYIQRRRLGAVLDQGVLQALWSLQLRAVGGGGSALIAGMLKDAACSGRVHVSVETPPEVCLERLGLRASKHSRMQDTGATCDHRAWETAERLRLTVLRNLQAAYRKQGIPPWIIVVDGTADPVDAAGQIVAGLLRPRPDHVPPQSEYLRELKA